MLAVLYRNSLLQERQIRQLGFIPPTTVDDPALSATHRYFADHGRFELVDVTENGHPDLSCLGKLASFA